MRIHPTNFIFKKIITTQEDAWLLSSGLEKAAVTLANRNSHSS
jgi:hypothetical protein